MILTYILLFSYLAIVKSFTIQKHPFESRIAYIYGLKNVNKLDQTLKNDLLEVFSKHPLLIFKDVDNITPHEFIDFVKIFDKEAIL